jgi:hypothetical protein
MTHEDAETNSSVRYEPTDVAAGKVWRFMAALVAVLVLMVAGVWLTVDRLQTVAVPVGEETRTGGPSLPPTPRLEGIDLERSKHNIGRLWEGPAKQQTEAEEARLARYGWVDRSTGKVHIPIEEAMKQIIGRLRSRNQDRDEGVQEAPVRARSGRSVELEKGDGP